MDNKKGVRNLILALLVPVAIIIVVLTMTSNVNNDETKYSEILKYFDYTQAESETVESWNFSLETGKLTIKLLPEKGKDKGEEITYKVPNISLFNSDITALRDECRENDPDNAMLDIPYDIEPQKEDSWLVTWLPTILLIGTMVLFWVIFMRRMNGAMNENNKTMSFGKAKYRKVDDEKKKTTFNDVAGADEEKEELTEIVDYLKNPKKYTEIGAHIPKGVLLVGPPGTGKTLLAKAVAGEAGVPFFSISGSDFVEMFVGVGASRVRDLFDQAIKNAPAIVFIDEIDAVGRHRGSGLGGGHDEREQTLNQLLVEMDGFGANEGVIVIAATNRPDILDPALTRPGRFDRQVMVGYPDIKGREEVLKVHAKGKNIAPDVDLSEVAKGTAGFTGADLENLLNEAALLAVRKGLKAITQEQLDEATIKVIAGTEKKSKVITPKEKKLTAYHEAGHAVAAYFCKSDPVHQISIIPRGMAGGYTIQLPQEDRSYRIRSEMIDDIVVLLGGRVAEALVLDDISTGASNDIERATKMAREMVTKYGMSEKLGPITFGSSEGSEIFLGRDMGHVKNFSESVAQQIDEEIKSIIVSCYNKTADILKNNMQKLTEVAEHLIKSEKMDGDEFKKIMEKVSFDF